MATSLGKGLSDEEALELWAKLTEGAVNGVKVVSGSTGKTEPTDWEEALEGMLEELLCQSSLDPRTPWRTKS